MLFDGFMNEEEVREEFGYGNEVVVWFGMGKEDDDCGGEEYWIVYEKDGELFERRIGKGFCCNEDYDDVEGIGKDDVVKGFENYWGWRGNEKEKVEEVLKGKGLLG